MSGEFENPREPETERGRSPSSVSDGMDPVLAGPAPAEPVGEVASGALPVDVDAERSQAPAPPSIGGRDQFAGLRLAGTRSRQRMLSKAPPSPPPALTVEQRLLVLDIWRRSGVSAGDFGGLVGLAPTTLYHWKKKFETLGPGGLVEQPRGAPRGSKLPELTRRTILMMKESNPAWGCQRISDMLLRGPALPASPGAVARVLKEEGYQLEEAPAHPHAPPVREFERARPNQLWQSDLFTFVLKRQNRRVYLVVFMDDHSRYVVGYGLHGSQSAALVLEVLRSAIASYQAPEEILTDNGSQYVTWRGRSAFRRELEKLGIRHVVASPRHPQTLGKLERFWGSLWRECVEAAIFLDLYDAQRRIGLYIDHHNFQRPHQGIGGLVPADRYFGAAPEVLRTLKERVSANALELARSGIPRPPFYLTGQVGGQAFSLHAEGERVILTRKEGEREEVALAPPAAERLEIEPAAKPPCLPAPLCPSAALGGPEPGSGEVPPGVSALEQGLEALKESLDEPEEGGER